MDDKTRRYQVSGIDQDGDVHVFESNDLERAAGAKAQFDEDLEQVDFREDIDLAEGGEAPGDRQRRLKCEP